MPESQVKHRAVVSRATPNRILKRCSFESDHYRDSINRCLKMRLGVARETTARCFIWLSAKDLHILDLQCKNIFEQLCFSSRWTHIFTPKHQKYIHRHQSLCARKKVKKMHNFGLTIFNFSDFSQEIGVQGG